MSGLTPFGWDELSSKFKHASDGLVDRTEDVLDSIANVFVDAAKSFAPRSAQSTRGENYASSIKVVGAGPGFRVVGSDKFVEALATGRVYNLGLILERGSASHEIRPILADVLFWI